MERRIRQRIELQEQHSQQMHFKNLRKQAESDEEEIFRQQVFHFVIIPHTYFHITHDLVLMIIKTFESMNH